MYFLDNSSAKYSTNRLGTYDGITFSQTFSIGKVISVDDPQAMGRIKVYVNGTTARGGDNGITNLIDVKTNDINPSSLPWAMPMNSMFSSQPKVGEAVIVFNIDNKKTGIDRIYIGPIISQPQNLNYEAYDFSPLNGLTASNKEPDKSVFDIPELREGVFPKGDEVSIQGRFNTDITQKNNEIIIRAGKFESSNSNKFNITFNNRTQAFIQIKNDVSFPSIEDPNEKEFGTITNIVASKINLLTHKNGAPIINLNPTDLINDEQMKKVFAEAHQLPFGDILLEYLRLLKDAIFYHVHNGNGNPATDLTGEGNSQSIAVLKSKADDLEKRMLSKNIRIN
jgi:hypothetical protein